MWELFTSNEVKLLELEYVDGHVNGKYKQYYSDGSLYISGFIESDSIKTGRWEERYGNGVLKSEGYYENNLKNGSWNYYKDTALPFLESEYVNDTLDGPYKEFKTGRRHPWAEDRVM